MMQTQGLSTKNIQSWPDGIKLRTLCETLAALSWIQTDLERFEMKTKENGEAVFQFANAEGDSATILFDENGVVFKGFAHESVYAFWGAEDCPWPKEDGKWLPKELQKYWESDIEDEDISFIAWYFNKEKKWYHLDLKVDDREDLVKDDDVHDPNGSECIWDYLPMTPELYVEWEGAYIDRELDLDVVKAIYNKQPLTKAIVTRLNPDFDFTDKKHFEVLSKIPYPSKF